MRPWQAYRMSSAILARTGAELGQTFHGHHDFQLTDDIIHKVHIGHYTFYSKSIVRSPKHMYIASNVYCQGYEYGENNTFVAPGNVEEGLPVHDSQDIKSIVCVAVDLHDTLPNPLCADARGFHVTMPSIDINANESGRFRLINEDSDDIQALRSYFDNSPDSATFGDDTRHANRVCWRGCSKHYNVSTSNYSDVVVSTGHWGPNVYDGCGDVRKGAYANLKECKY